MKATMLKIAGVKTESAFYKKYPTQADFMKIHDKEFKKAQIGTQIQSVSQLKPVGSTDNSIGGIGGFDISTLGKQGPKTSNMPGASQIIGAVGGLVDAAGAFKQERKQLRTAQQSQGVTDVQLQAANSRDVDSNRQIQDTISKQRNAMMQPMTGENLFPVNGVGTNVLARNGRMLQDGGSVGGNSSEIQNTYAPNDLYDNLGYEPLSDSEIVKQYRAGGFVKAQGGFSSFMGAGGTDAATKMAGSAFGNNAGSQMGAAVGNAVKMIPGVGPVVGAVAAPVLSLIGGGLDQAFGDAGKIKKAQAATDRNMAGISAAGQTKGIQQQNQSYMEDGGWVSNDWTPQVIASFGDHSAKDVYDYAHEGMDTLRAGGHLKSYTEPSERSLQTFGLGGELQTHWGGGAESLSHNPYLPGTGETVMFRGQSHDETDGRGNSGIGITYSGNPVEVERGEPMVELEEGGVVDPETGEVQKSGVVYGNLMIDHKLLGDPKAKGKKFKNYVADLSKAETRQNSLIEKSTNELNALDTNNAFDQLKLTALQANIKGGNMKLKDIADKKINAAHLQNAINDTAEEHGLVADDLARGKTKIDKEAMKSREARCGQAIQKAQDGTYTVKGNLPGSIDYNAIGETAGGEMWKDQTTYDNVWKPKVYSAFSDPRRAEELIKNLESYTGQDSADVQAAIKKGKTLEEKKAIAIRLATDNKVGPFHKLMNSTINATLPDVTPSTTTTNTTTPIEDKTTAKVEANKRNPYIDAFNQALPYFRPSDQESLDPNQLTGEMYAMSNNQLEPVQANFYRPEIGTPYDISYQDQLNANQSDYRSAQRMSGYNPAAQANLNAQKYHANSQVLGEQFRANQAMKDKVYGENRNILNDAKLKNLGIADQQYQRQTEAKSNTKATTQAALNSISDKYAKNKLENRTLGVMENMYNYRYDDKGRAINENPLFQANIPTVGTASNNDGLTEYERAKAMTNAYEAKIKKDTKAATPKKRNGSIVQAIKNL